MISSCDMGEDVAECGKQADKVSNLVEEAESLGLFIKEKEVDRRVMDIGTFMNLLREGHPTAQISWCGGRVEVVIKLEQCDEPATFGCEVVPGDAIEEWLGGVYDDICAYVESVRTNSKTHGNMSLLDEIKHLGESNTQLRETIVKMKETLSNRNAALHNLELHNEDLNRVNNNLGRVRDLLQNDNNVLKAQINTQNKIKNDCRRENNQLLKKVYDAKEILNVQ